VARRQVRTGRSAVIGTDQLRETGEGRRPAPHGAERARGRPGEPAGGGRTQGPSNSYFEGPCT